MTAETARAPDGMDPADTGQAPRILLGDPSTLNFEGDIIMAHKKIERKKELDRKRHRRVKREKQRIKEAKAAAAANKA